MIDPALTGLTGLPPSIEFGTAETGKASFWSFLSPFSVRNRSSLFSFSLLA
jgi:hypothetical protein